MPTGKGAENVSYKYNVVRSGDAVSAVIDVDATTEDCICTVDEGRGRYSYFAVCALIGNTTNGEVWAVVKDICVVGSDVCDYHSCERMPIKILQVTRYVRMVGLVHKCDDNCSTEFAKGKESHCYSVLQCGRYSVIGRHDGYPSFLG